MSGLCFCEDFGPGEICLSCVVSARRQADISPVHNYGVECVRGFWVSGDSHDDVLVDACNKVISARVRSGLTACGQWSVIDLAEHINGRRPDLSMGTLTDTAIARMLADCVLAMQKYQPR